MTEKRSGHAAQLMGKMKLISVIEKIFQKYTGDYPGILSFLYDNVSAAI